MRAKLPENPTPAEVLAELRYWQAANGAPVWAHAVALIERLMKEAR